MGQRLRHGQGFRLRSPSPCHDPPPPHGPSKVPQAHRKDRPQVHRHHLQDRSRSLPNPQGKGPMDGCPQEGTPPQRRKAPQGTRRQGRLQEVHRFWQEDHQEVKLKMIKKQKHTNFYLFLYLTFFILSIYNISLSLVFCFSRFYSLSSLFIL